MNRLGWLTGCALALACAHEGKSVTGESETKMPSAAATEGVKPQAPSTADASKQKEVVAAAPAVGPVAAKLPDGKIPLSTTPEAAELLRSGYDAQFTTNIDTALGFYKKALELDPTFLAAQVFLYSATPGTESMYKVEEATKAGTGLSEAERTLLEWMNAGKHGDLKTDVEKAARLVELAPKDPIAFLALAQDDLVARKLDEALAGFQKASDLDPHLGAPYVQMSFIYDVQGKHDEEVAVLRKWVAARPDDPAAQSGLAAGLMAAGKFDEAEDSARKATAMAQAGWDTWLTLAYVDEMRGEWAAARRDLATGRDLAQSGASRAAIDEQMAFVDLAQHKNDAATADLDAMTKDAADGEDPNDVVRANIDLAVVHLAGGKLTEAVKTAKQAADRIANEAVSDVARGFLSREALTVAVWVDAVAKKPAEAAEALARLEKASPDADKDAFQADGLAYARGEVAWAKGDLKSAVEQLSKCIVEDDLCRFRLAAAQEKSGDKAAAAATRKAILDARHAGKFALLVRAWLTEPPRAGKKVAARD
jgi:tetratricopeptide (TPR) repeat protein